MYSFNNGVNQPISMPNLLLRYGAFDKLNLDFHQIFYIIHQKMNFPTNPIQLELKFN